MGNCRNLSRKTRRSAGVQAAVCRSASSAATGSGTRAFRHTKRRAARSRASVCIAGHCRGPQDFMLEVCFTNVTSTVWYHASACLAVSSL